jgi:methionyl-tRNA formyltransferase
LKGEILVKTILIGGLRNGKMIAQYLNNSKSTEILKVYVIKDELGKDISDFVTLDDILSKEKLQKVDNINKYEEEIINLNADIIFVVGWSQLISKRIINSAKIGVIGFHPAKLPKDRGRSVLAWQLAEGYKRGCVSMIWIDSGVDSGDIIGQADYEINYNDTIRDILDKVYNLCLDLTETYYPLILKGNLIHIKQDNNNATYRRKRVKKDGTINWNKNSYEIYNLVRAITEPYPCAISYCEGREFSILSCSEVKVDSIYNNEIPGTILGFELNKGMIIKTKDNGILIEKIKIDKEYILNNELQKHFSIGKLLEEGE